MTPEDFREAHYEERLECLAQRIPDFHPEVPRALLALAQSYDRLDRSLNCALGAVDLSLAGFNVLTILDHRRAVPLKELSTLLLRSPANITGLVDSLVRRGLVKRSPHPEDRRVKLAVLLPAGKALLDDLFPRYHCMTRRLVADLSQAELRQLTELLGKLRRSIREHCKEVPL